ncbi:MAG: hypothetical protein K6T66_03290 [Peptococcaceae bacterium]|nr:hypothetical protein [Peptococcaceae bacterium]
MTTAQLTGGIDLNLLREYGHPDKRKAAAGRSGRVKGRAACGRQAEFIRVWTERMDRADTPADKLAGYGLCGLTLAYLAGHAIKAFF